MKEGSKVALTIDVHSHMYPAWYVDFFAARSDPPCVVDADGGRRFLLFQNQAGTASGPLLTAEYMQVERKIEFMDVHGIDCSIVSLGNPWLDSFDVSESVELARESNARLARYRSESSGRIVGMGILPSAPPATIAKVVTEIAEEPDLRGIITGPRIGRLLLDDPLLEPVWNALADTRIPLLIHPVQTYLSEDIDGYSNCIATGVAFPFVTTVALSRLIMAGVLERHPNLRIVAAHGGGALPFLIGRLDASCTNGGAVWREARQLLFDAVLHDVGAVRLAAELVGPDKLLFGTDHPFSNEDCEGTKEAIAGALGAEEAQKVLGAAAAEWYGISEGM